MNFVVLLSWHFRTKSKQRRVDSYALQKYLYEKWGSESKVRPHGFSFITYLKATLIDCYEILLKFSQSSGKNLQNSFEPFRKISEFCKLTQNSDWLEKFRYITQKRSKIMKIFKKVIVWYRLLIISLNSLKFFENSTSDLIRILLNFSLNFYRIP